MNKPANPVSPHEALIYAMVTLAAADQAMTDNELMKIGDIVKTLPVFRDFDSERLVKAAEACGAILQKEDGLDLILDRKTGGWSGDISSPDTAAVITSTHSNYLSGSASARVINFALRFQF